MNPRNHNAMKANFYSVLFLISATVMGLPSFGQDRKVINDQYQSWISINNTVRLSSKWGFLLDLHERRNNFLSDASFHFVRAAANYWIKDNLTAAVGYGHMWLAPTTSGWKTFANEERVYQQVQLVSKVGKVSMMQRLRNEQRWQEKMANDKGTGDYKFTDRVRYLLSFTIPVFKDPQYPSLVLADELAVQFGKEVVYNTFEQNRVFVGIKEPVTKNLSFDLGYMMVLQQKATGNAYDRNHTFRWFFYYTPDFRSKEAH